MITKCKDCGKEIDESDIYTQRYNLCEDCVLLRAGRSMDRAMSTGRCSICNKLVTDETEKEFFKEMGYCWCFFDSG